VLSTTFDYNCGMPNVVDETRLAAWRNVLTAHATLVDLIDHQLVAAQRIPLHWYDVLIELLEAPENRLRLNELAQRVVLSRSGLTRLIDKLEAAGLLYRQSVESDRRGAFAVLTDAGKQALRQAWPVYASGISRYFASQMSEAEARVIGDVFGRIVEAARYPNTEES
jgi:DNA-binding MarR family transcriptional regulator